MTRVDKDSSGGPSSRQKSSKKKSNKQKEKTKEILTDEIIAEISMTLPRYDWVKFAHLLGFLRPAIAAFNRSASSSDNHYSQCQLMLKTWRFFVPPSEIVIRLEDAFRRMRRGDLANKIVADINARRTIFKTSVAAQPEIQLTTRVHHVISKRTEAPVTKVDVENCARVLPDDKIESLARKLLQNEDWQRLAYALGLLPCDVARVIGRASSGHNLFAQARFMLMEWRSRTGAREIHEKLKRAFLRIRRHDLLHLHRLHYFTTAPPTSDDRISMNGNSDATVGKATASNMYDLN